MSNKLNQLSKTVSYYLRHKPEELGLKLDKDGWVDIDLLLSKLSDKNVPLDRASLNEIVASDNKGRYTIKENSIRANQGHSTSQVDLNFKKETPPIDLFHGTGVSSWDQIKNSEGLNPMSRHYVHLSQDKDTAQKVADRSREKTIILKIKARAMVLDGHSFYLSENGVWLTDSVPLKYIEES